MSNQINLDLLADTSQAQKAISDLTKDVDKLQKKAAQTQFGGGKSGERSSYNKNTRQVADTKNKAQQSKAIDSSALKSAFASLTSQLGVFTSNLANTASTLSTLADAAITLNQSFQAIKATNKALKAAARKRARENALTSNTESALGERRRKSTGLIRRLTNRIARGEIRFPDDYTPEEIARTTEWAQLRAPLANRRYQRETMKTAWRNAYGPSDTTGETLTARQRWNRGVAQASGQWRIPGNRFAPGGHYLGGGGRLSGIGNMALAGALWTGQGVRAGGTAIARGVGAVGSGIARGVGAVGRAGAAALQNPYVLGAAAVGAIVGSPYLYANSQANKGRQKAEDLTDLQTQFKTLSKNISGVEVDALSKDLQKLAIEGAVPVQELSKGASMLMLAFKGNQKETSKWTEILADMSAGTGQSVDYFAELIAKANQFGTVEFEVFNQLNEKGIPIIEQLKGKFGDTREEIMKAAQEGKITAAEFMKAFEAAHKVSMEGANARKAAASRMDIQKQTQEYEELEAANVTRGFDEAQMEYDKARRDRAKRRSEDENIIATSEALGDALGDLVQVCRMAGNGIVDAFEGAFHWIADLAGWDEDHAVATQDRMVKDANNILFDAMEDSATSQGVQSSIGKLEKDIERLNNQAAHEDFDDETRARAKDRAEYLSGIVETLEKRSAELAKKEDKRRRDAEAAEARREREASRQRASEEYKKFKEKLPETEEEWLALSGEKTYAKLDNRIKWLQDRLENGYADESEFDEMERLYKIREEIDKLRKQLAKEAEDAREEAEREKKEAEKRAEEERKKQQKRDDYLLEDKVSDYSRRYEAEKNLKYRQEAEKLRKKGYSEDYIKEKLQQQDLVKRPGEDYKSKYELQYSREAEKMREMGFTQQQIEVKLKADKKDDLYYARGQLAANKEKIRQEEENIKNSKMTGKEGIENAWGSVGRVITSFTSPYEQNSLKELKEINKNLKSEINAIKGIDTKSKAQ